MGLTTCILDLARAPISRNVADWGAKVRLRCDDIWAEEVSEGPIRAASRGPGAPFPPSRRGRPGPVGPTALAKCNFPSAESRSVTFSTKDGGLYWL